MKRSFFLLLIFLAAYTLTAQDTQALYKSRFSYDLKQDKLSVKFDGKVFWLRISAVTDKTLTLTYFLKGDTPTTATEFLTFQLLPLDLSVDDFVNDLANRTRPLSSLPADITEFENFPGGKQSIASVMVRDPSNNLMEDSIFKATKLNGQKLRIAVHTKRLKLSEADANPDLAASQIGDQRKSRLLEINKLIYPF